MTDTAIWVWICNDCQAGQCGLCIEANETQTPGPGCDCEHEDWDEPRPPCCRRVPRKPIRWPLAGLWRRLREGP